MHGEAELKRFRETMVVLYKMINSADTYGEYMNDYLNDAIHDIVFGHSIRNAYYLTEEEYIKTEDEILEMLNINREDEW